MPNLVLPDHQDGEVLPGIHSRQYQLDALGVLADKRAKGDQTALVQMATGLGKTSLGTLDIHNFLVEAPGSRVLFLAHRLEILSQAWGRMSKPLAEHALSYYFLQPQLVPDNLDEMSFVFASFQMMHRGTYQGEPIRNLFAPSDFDYVLVDEAHHATAPTYQPTLEYLSPRFMLGLTATPDRSDTRNIRYIFGPEVYKKTLPEGISEGYLAKPHYIAIAPKVTIEEIEEGHTEGDESESSGSLDRKTAIEISEDVTRRTSHIKDPKILVFTHSIDEAELYAEVMPNARAIHSGARADDRYDMLEDFRVNRPRTLTSIDIMNEGIDVADIDAIVMVRSTASETVLLQQLGRGLRKTTNKDEVLILDYVANAERLEMIARLINGFPRPRNKPEEDKPKRRKPRLDEVIKAPEIALQNATFEFDDSVLDIVQILHNREELKRQIAAQTTSKSVDEYLALCEEHGRLLSVKALRKILGPNSTELLLMPFNGHISELREGAGYPLLANHPELVSVSAASTELGINYRKLLQTIERLDINVWDGIANMGMVTRSIKKENVDDIKLLMGQQELPTYPSIPESHVHVGDVRQKLAPNESLSAFRLILRSLNITERRYMIFVKGTDSQPPRRAVVGSIDRAEEGRIAEFLQSLPTASKKDISIEEIVRQTGEKEIGYIVKELGVRGWSAYSPTSGRIEMYIHPAQARRIRQYIGK